jgi:hypothetical protein
MKDLSTQVAIDEGQSDGDALVPNAMNNIRMRYVDSASHRALIIVHSIKMPQPHAITTP